jgi:putative transposase
MILVAKVKLNPTKYQASVLRQTLEQVNGACNWLGDQAWKQHVFGQYHLHRLFYYTIREQFGFSANIAVRLIGKVAAAYKLDRKNRRTFRKHGAIDYDHHILHWYPEKQDVSILTVTGRERIPFVCGPRQQSLLASRQGQSSLALVDGKFYLLACCNVETPEPADVSDYLGVDLGIANIATDGDGTTYSGAQVNGLRHRHRRLRNKLQAKGTKASTRLLRARSGKESRFAADINHQISKNLVATAQGTGRGLALEDLQGIRDRVTVRKSQRATLHSWSFWQLRSFVNYKSALVGVPVVFVDPRNTSRTCPECGHIDKANRRSQNSFSCVSCGFSGLADHIAAINIGRRAATDQPYAAGFST